MVNLDETRSAPVEQLWDQLNSVHAGMLGVEGSGQHMQPMAPQVDRDANRIWFYSRKDSDLIKAAGEGAKAHFCIVGERHDYHACMSGELVENADQKKIDAFWSPIIAAWYDGGKSDPNLTLLEFRLKNAAVWASSANPVKFGWEIAKANLSSGEPDLGARANIQF